MKNQGIFVLRIEDTDRERLVEGAVQQIQDSLTWLGLEWDEGPDIGGDLGPYVQSERLELYRQYSNAGVEKGFLYRCWCSPERLDSLRKEAQKNHCAFKYDRHCLENPGDSSTPHVLRFKVPSGQTVSWDDAVRGQLTFASDDIDDFVAVKSDGFPTYHFASVVDDHLMEISHVLRGDEWIASGPKHVLLYQAYGWNPPIFAHLPQVLGSDKAKLSKRHGAKSVLEYRDEGYLPEAVVNFMALLGWNPGDGSTQEIFNQEELINTFSLEHVQSSPAIFDPERLNWLNGLYIRRLPIDELFIRSQAFLPTPAKKYDKDYQKQALGLVQERLKYLTELPELTDFFFTDPKVDSELLPIGAKDSLKKARDVLKNVEFNHDNLETALRQLAEDLGIKAGELFGHLRVAITGKTAAPGLFETMTVLGKETVLNRLESTISASNI